MAEILVISGHPDYKHSFANKKILEELEKLVPTAQIVLLDELYPDFNINVSLEQERLLSARILVFEFPFWWYSSPSLLHRYVEKVFTHGFAYGSQGTRLHGKKFILSFTTGASEQDYSPAGHQGYDISAFLPPFLAMAHLTGLEYQGAVISYSMALLAADDQHAVQAILGRAKEHAARLASMIKGQKDPA